MYETIELRLKSREGEPMKENPILSLWGTLTEQKKGLE